MSIESHIVRAQHRNSERSFRYTFHRFHNKIVESKISGSLAVCCSCTWWYTQNISLTQSHLKFTAQSWWHTELKNSNISNGKRNTRERERTRRKKKYLSSNKSNKSLVEIRYWIQIEINDWSNERAVQRASKARNLLGDNMRRLNKLSIIVCHIHHTRTQNTQNKEESFVNRREE